MGNETFYWDGRKRKKSSVPFNLIPRVLATFKMADGGEDPGASCKVLHEWWSNFSCNTRLRRGYTWKPFPRLLKSV